MTSPPKYPVIHSTSRAIGWVEWSDERQMWSIRFDDKIIAELGVMFKLLGGQLLKVMGEAVPLFGIARPG